MLHHTCVVNIVVVSFNRCVVCEKHAHKPQDISREKAITPILAERILIRVEQTYERISSTSCRIVISRVFDKIIRCTIGPKSFLFRTAQFSLWASGSVDYHYIVTNIINSLVISSRCIPNGAHTNHY